MKTIGKYALAFALAAVVPALIFHLLEGLFLAALIYAILHIYYLAFLTFLVFQILDRVNIRTSVTAGFVMGCIPTALIVSLDVGYRSLLGVMNTGALGAIGGLVFWLVISIDKEDVLTKSPPVHHGIYILAFVLATVVPTVIYKLFFGTYEDWSGFFTILHSSLMFADAPVLVLPLPIFLLCWCLGLINQWTSVIIGFAVGAVPAMLYGDIDAVDMLLRGAMGGLVFWLVSRCASEPDDPHISGRAV